MDEYPKHNGLFRIHETDQKIISCQTAMLLNNGDTYTPDDADIIAWEKAYPAIDVYQELNAMESWLDANPTWSRRKTPKGIKRFVNSWLARAQI